MDYRYGHNLRYDEATLMGEGAVGFAKGWAMSLGTIAMTGAVAVRPLRNLLNRFLPQPGEGATKSCGKVVFLRFSFLPRVHQTRTIR